MSVPFALELPLGGESGPPRPVAHFLCPPVEKLGGDETGPSDVDNRVLVSWGPNGYSVAFPGLERHSCDGFGSVPGEGPVPDIRLQPPTVSD